MFRAKAQQLAGWGGFPRQEASVYRIDAPGELPDLLDGVKESLIPRGQGRSYGDAALNAGGQVLGLRRMDRYLGFDEATGTLMERPSLAAFSAQSLSSRSIRSTGP